MNLLFKTIIGTLTAIIAGLGLLVFSLETQQPEPTLAGFGTQVDRTASGTAVSATGVYFHGAVEARTATTVVLTVGNPAEADKLGIRVIVKNATNSPGTIYLFPEISTDATTWGSVHLNETTSTGGAVAAIDLGNGSTSLITYTPASQGTTSALKTFYSPVIGGTTGGFLRFSMWSTGTSSNLIEVYKLLK